MRSARYHSFRSVAWLMASCLWLLPQVAANAQDTRTVTPNTATTSNRTTTDLGTISMNSTSSGATNSAASGASGATNGTTPGAASGGNAGTTDDASPFQTVSPFEQAFLLIAESLRPSVVGIVTAQTSEAQRFFEQHPWFGQKRTATADLLQEFFGSSTTQNTGDYAIGSGVVVRNDGHIVTNEHVVGSLQQVTVVASDGTRHTATVKGRDAARDLALLKVTAPSTSVTTWAAATVGDSDQVKAGQWAVAVGQLLARLPASEVPTQPVTPIPVQPVTPVPVIPPTNPVTTLTANPASGTTAGNSNSTTNSTAAGFEPTLTPGLISALHRSIAITPNPATTQAARNFDDLIQSGAEINPGQSGGPLVDLDGHVIGITVGILTESRALEGLGFAIRANTVRAFVELLLDDDNGSGGGGQATDLGLSVEDHRDNDADNPLCRFGARVTAVTSGGAAAQAGIQVGDIIIRFNNQPIQNAQQLRDAIQQAPAGQQVAIELFRNDQLLTVQLTVPASQTVVVIVNPPVTTF